MKAYPNFRIALLDLYRRILDQGKVIDIQRWQSTELERKMRELFEVSFSVPISFDCGDEVKADKNWCQLHFEERISGQPLNPGESYKYWPYYGNDEKWRKDEKFSHTYMERIWPKWAGKKSRELEAESNRGIRFKYGDLDDVIKLLRKDINTRQAFLPIWFPEDTGVVHGERVPCTLGYLFNFRHGYLHCTYYIRSCDMIRHFHNDLWLTNELAIYVWNKLNRYFLGQPRVQLGNLYFHCASLHVFEDEKGLIETNIRRMENETT